jgi:hypothetical protein
MGPHGSLKRIPKILRSVTRSEQEVWNVRFHKEV